jgi:hypothetical protein
VRKEDVLLSGLSILRRRLDESRTLTDVDMIHGDCGAYAIEPFTFTSPSTRIISPQMADSRLVWGPHDVNPPSRTSASGPTHLSRTHAAPEAHELALAQREVDALEYRLPGVTVPTKLATLDHERL